MTEELNDQTPKLPQLSMREAEDLTAAVADVAAVGLPLAEGLRAAAAETRNRRVAGELRWIASQIEAGRSAEDVLGVPRQRLPGYVSGLIKSALRTGKLGEVLVELVDHQQTARDMWRTVRAALAYPMALLTLALAVGFGVELYLVGPMCDMFEEFELTLPVVTQFLVWGHRSGVPWLLGTFAFFVLAATAFRVFSGPALWRRCLGTVPIIGALWHWSGVAELSRVMAVLTEQEIPLPEALQLAADGVHDADMKQLSRELAVGVEQGRSLSELVADSFRLPPTLVPLIHWGEQAGELSTAFRRAGEMFEGRVQMRAALVRSVLPPLIFIVVAITAVVLIFGLYAPLISLIQGLS